MPETIDIRKLVEDATRRFRSLAEAESATSVEQFASQLDPFPRLPIRDRKKLLGALIKSEIEGKQRRGASTSISEYLERFPEFDRAFLEGLIALPEMPPPLERESALPEHYRRIAKIGTGGVGIVWRVYDERMKRFLAIKTLKPRYRDNWMANQRLRRESVLAGGLQHPGIPPVYEQGMFPDGSQYFAMKLVEGKTLAEILETESRSVPALIGVFEQVAQTLAYVHSKQVIHRDIKPQNIMVGAFGEVQLMDWGMAKQIETPRAERATDPIAAAAATRPVVCTSELLETARSSIDSSLVESIGLSTRQGDVYGTPAYMSPEQATGDVESIDRRSDVFGLGHLLFEILAQQRLYECESATDALKRAAECDYGSIAQRLNNCNVDTELATLCCACVSVSPDDRPDHAGMVADAIANYQSNVQSRLKQAEIERSSAIVQSLEQKKRAHVVVGMSALVAIVSLIGAAGFAYQMQQAIASVKRANRESKTRAEIGEFFIFDVLNQADPNVEPNRDLKVRTALDRAAATISTRFQDRPEIESEIRIQLGKSYFGLGEYEAAGAQFSRALALVESFDGAESDRVWDLEHKMGQVASGLGDEQRALEIFDEVHAAFAGRHGERSPQALQVLADKSSVLTSLARFQEANKIASDLAAIVQQQPMDGIRLNSLRVKQAVNLLEMGKFSDCRDQLRQLFDSLQGVIVEDANGRLSTDGDQGKILDYLNAKMVEGNVLELQEGDFSKAELLYLDLLDASEELLGTKHSTTFEVINNLAIAMMRQGKFATAQQILEERIPDAIEMIGASHGLTIRLKNSLASCYAFAGETELAVDEFHELEKTLAGIHDQPHYNVIANHQNLGGLYYRMKDYQRSEKYLTLAMADSKILFGEEHPRTIVTLASLAKTHGALKKYDDAEIEFLRALELGETVLTADHPDNMITLNDLCHMYMVSRQFEKSLPNLQRLLRIRRDADGPDAASTMKTTGDLGVAHYELDQFADARPFLRQSHEFRSQKYGSAQKRTLTRFLTLVKTEMELEEFDSAKQQLEDKLGQLDPDQNAWQILRLESYLAQAQAGLGNAATAESRLVSIFERQKRFDDVSPRDKNRALRTTARLLVDHFEKTGDLAEQELWQATLDSVTVTQD